MNMRRREFIRVVCGAAAAWPLAARAQQPNAIKRVGWLSNTAEQDPQTQAQLRAFREEFAKLGWTDGQNWRIEYRSTMGGDDSSARAIGKEMVVTAPDIIITQGTQLTAILKEQTSRIPIIFANVADPVVSGLVASFAHPEGNITGFTNVEPSFVGKWLSILKDFVPAITRVLVLYDADNSNWIAYLRTIQDAAPLLRVDVIAVAVNRPDELAQHIEPFSSQAGAGMIVLPSGFMAYNRQKITALAAQYRLPAIYWSNLFPDSGGLVSYGPEPVDIYRQAASYVDRILRGTKPGDLPVQAPVKFELIINLKAAKAIGLDIPYNVLLLADRVID